MWNIETNKVYHSYIGYKLIWLTDFLLGINLNEQLQRHEVPYPPLIKTGNQSDRIPLPSVQMPLSHTD